MDSVGHSVLECDSLGQNEDLVQSLGMFSLMGFLVHKQTLNFAAVAWSNKKRQSHKRSF